jgi:selenophosphate synthase
LISDSKYKIFTPPIGEGVYAKVYKAEMLKSNESNNEPSKKQPMLNQIVAIKGNEKNYFFWVVF